MWTKAGVKFITSNGQKISGKSIPIVILVTGGVGEGKLGMVATLCHHDQAKVETSKALFALCQHDSLEPSVVVVRRYTNSLYLPWGPFSFLYLYMTTLSGGTSSAQFPMDWLCLCRLHPYSNTKVVLLGEEGEEGLKVYPFFQETLWKSSKEEHQLSILMPLSVPSLPPIPTEKRAPRHRKDQAFTQPSNSCKTPSRQESSCNVT